MSEAEVARGWKTSGRNLSTNESTGVPFADEFLCTHRARTTVYILNFVKNFVNFFFARLFPRTEHQTHNNRCRINKRTLKSIDITSKKSDFDRTLVTLTGVSVFFYFRCFPPSPVLSTHNIWYLFIVEKNLGNPKNRNDFFRALPGVDEYNNIL